MVRGMKRRSEMSDARQTTPIKAAKRNADDAAPKIVPQRRKIEKSEKTAPRKKTKTVRRIDYATLDAASTEDDANGDFRVSDSALENAAEKVGLVALDLWAIRKGEAPFEVPKIQCPKMGDKLARRMVKGKLVRGRICSVGHPSRKKRYKAAFEDGTNETYSYSEVLALTHLEKSSVAVISVPRRKSLDDAAAKKSPPKKKTSPRRKFNGIVGSKDSLYDVSYVRPNSARMSQQSSIGLRNIIPQTFRTSLNTLKRAASEQGDGAERCANNALEAVKALTVNEVSMACSNQSGNRARYLLPPSAKGSLRSSMIPAVAKCSLLNWVSCKLNSNIFSVLHFKYNESSSLDANLLTASSGILQSDVQITGYCIPRSGEFYVSNTDITDAATGIQIAHKASDEAQKSVLGLRLEMYVAFDLWERLSPGKRMRLSLLIHAIGNFVTARIHDQNQMRIRRPIRLMPTRASFMFDLVGIETEVKIRGGERRATKVEYYFKKDNVPPIVVKNQIPDPCTGLYPVGVATYYGIYSNERVSEIEKEVDAMVDKMNAHTSSFGLSAHRTYHTNGRLARTKFFFGARYLWRAEEFSEPLAEVANGIRVDVQ